MAVAGSIWLGLLWVWDAPRFVTLRHAWVESQAGVCDRKKLHLLGAAFQRERGGQEALDSPGVGVCNHSPTDQLSCDK